MAIPIIAGASRVAPSVLTSIMQKQPGVISRAKAWISQKIGKPVTDLRKWIANDDANAAVLIESIVRNGVPMAQLRQMVPVLDREEYRELVAAFLSLEEQVEDRVSSANGGVTQGTTTISDAARIVYVKKQCDLLCRTLGIRSYDQLQDFIVAINSLNEEDLELMAVLYPNH